MRQYALYTSTSETFTKGVFPTASDSFASSPPTLSVEALAEALSHSLCIAFPCCTQALQTALQAVRGEEKRQPEKGGMCPINRERRPRNHEHSLLQCLLRKLADISFGQVHPDKQSAFRTLPAPRW